MTKDVLYFSKVDSQAVIPTKRDEDGAYDMYVIIDPRETEHEGTVYEKLIKKGEVTLLDTGIASAMSDSYALTLKSERSSVGKHGLVVLSGLIDSGYRGSIMAQVVALEKDILISSEVEEVEVYDDIVIYPYKKALLQARLVVVPDVEVKEMTHSELLEIPSLRGENGWGSSGK